LSGADVIPYDVICPAGQSDDAHLAGQVADPFNDAAVSFVTAFSSHLLNTPLIAEYPELASLAFWMRRAAIERLKNEFFQTYKDKVLQGRGMVFHIAPANVDTLFVYSWFLSLLAGNINIIRLSGTNSPQLEVLIEVLNSLLAGEQFSSIRDRTLLIRYGHDDAVTAYFSGRCDVRVIWGGDATITHIRSIPIPPAALELPFADKFSLAVVHADTFNRESSPEKVIDKFYNDAYWFGQMACSSPRLLVWLGSADEVEAAQHAWWPLVEKKTLQARPELSAADVMNKTVAADMAAVARPGVTLRRDEHGFMHRIQVRSLDDIDKQNHCGGGLFYETIIKTLAELAPGISRKNQTITSFGLSKEEWQQWIESARPAGIDRIVPIGQALNFSVTWDGVDLLRSFCREIVVRLN
jgi:hypothetical protein